MTEFDPASHRMVPEHRWFEDFVLGERFVIPSRTMTSAVFAAFQTASDNPKTRSETASQRTTFTVCSCFIKSPTEPA